MPLFRRPRKPEASQPSAFDPTRLNRSIRTLFTTAAGQNVWVMDFERSGTFPPWRAMRDVHPDTGLWPFILIGEDPQIVDLAHIAAQDADLDELKLGLSLHPEAVLEHLAARWRVDGGQDGNPDGAGELDESTYDQQASEVGPETLADLDALLPRDQPAQLALIEAAAGWEAPARLGWPGGTNYELTGAQHLAVLRGWQRRYGAEVFRLGFNSIELLVENPPTSKEEALAVAREQFAYCPDIVLQGLKTVGALAATQVRSRLWYFWWD